MAQPPEVFPTALAILRKGAAPIAEPDPNRIRSVDQLPLVRDGSDLAIAYLLEPELPQNAVVALTGDSGSGKSTLALWWAGQVARKGHPVLILDRENPRFVIADRLDRFNIDDGELLRYWGGWVPDESPQPFSPIVVDWVKQAERPPLIVIDSMIAFHGGNENDASDTRCFMHQGRRLADLGATVLVLHHDGKSETSRDFRGSSDFKASLDIGFHVSNSSLDGRLGTLRLRCFKSRMGTAAEVIYRYANDEFRRDDSDHAPMKTAAEQLTTILRIHPGLTKTVLEDLAMQQGISRNRTRDFIKTGQETGTVLVETLAKNKQLISLSE